MRKCLLLFGVLSLLLIFSSCANSVDNTKSSVAAKDFLQKYYTVDAQTVNSYKHISGSQNIDTKAILSIHEKLKTDMTDDAYTKIIANRFYLRNVGCAVKNNCEFKNSNISLTFNSNDSNITQYNFTAKITVRINATGKQQTVSESGLIQLTEQNGNWKVSYFNIKSPAKFIINANLIK